jgi:peptidoglycan hydrolase-like protein with peptidoglycan-binding domain
MKRAFLFLTLLSLAGLARADDQTQAVQQALKDQGFYYGEVDGQSGPETDAAIRRYQIRQGLHLGAKADGNTVEAVPPPPSGDAVEAQPPKSVVQSDHDFLRRQAPATPAPPANDDDAAPPPTQPQEPQPAQQPAEPPQPPDQADAGQTLPREYERFFRKTPYETAPPVVQRTTVQRAQERLARQGFYRGVADGELDDSLSRALAAYQRYAELAPTGRLDMDTLTDMNLLPKRRVVFAPPPYGYGGAPVYRGIWVH